MAITKQSIEKSVEVAVETIKDFFKNLINPNMKIEDISEVVESRLDDVIIEHEKRGLHYSAGKFYIKAVGEKNFQLEFEMFFKDDDNKWHKLANESELRDISLLEKGAAITVQKLKVVEFPISAPEIKPEDKAEAEKTVEEKFDEITGVKAEQEKIENAEIEKPVEEVTGVKIDKDKDEK